MITGKLSPAKFMSDYWQQKPLLIRQGLPGFTDPLSPEELAGLACEDGVESRLVTRTGKHWQLRSGPFRNRDFTCLPDRNWTLLVQAVDQWIPGVRQLLEQVAFIPQWRVDDVMISYATPGGGVGPHFDYYDVFLVQGLGTRRWRIGQHCSSADVTRTDSGLKQLKNFRCEAEYLLEPGDVLYVPPGIAHWGSAESASLCYSIGFRAPSLSEMLLGFSDSLSDNCVEDVRYTDPPGRRAVRAGEIDAAALKQARTMLLSALQDKDAFARWFGSLMTEMKYPELAEANDSPLPPDAADTGWTVNPASRVAWQQHGKRLLVFADGNCFDHPYSQGLLELAQWLASPVPRPLPARFLKRSGTRALLDQLHAQGSLLAGEG